MHPITNNQFNIKQDVNPSSQPLNWQVLIAKIQDDNEELNRQEMQETIEGVLNAIPSTDIWVDEILKSAQDEKLIPVLNVVFELCKNHPLVQELPLKLEERFSEISGINIDLLCYFMSPSALASKIIENYSYPHQKLAPTLLLKYMSILAKKLNQRKDMESEFKGFTQKDHERLYALCKIISSLEKDTFQKVLLETVQFTFESKIVGKTRNYPYFSTFCYSLSDRQWKEFIIPFLEKEKNPKKLFDLCQETTLMAKNCKLQHRLLDVVRILIKHPEIHAEEITGFFSSIFDKDVRLALWKEVSKTKFKQPQDLVNFFLNAKVHPEDVSAPMLDLIQDYLKDQSENAKLKFIQGFVPKKNDQEKLLTYWKHFSRCLLKVAPNLAAKLFIICKESGSICSKNREIFPVKITLHEDSDGEFYLDLNEEAISEKIENPMLEDLLLNILCISHDGLPGWKEAVAGVMEEAKLDLKSVNECIEKFALFAEYRFSNGSQTMQKMENAIFFKEVFSYVLTEYLPDLEALNRIPSEILAGLVLCNQAPLVLKIIFEKTRPESQVEKLANTMNLVASLQKEATEDLMKAWLIWLKEEKTSKMQAIIKLQPYLYHPEGIDSLLKLLPNEDFSELANHLVNSISELLSQANEQEAAQIASLWLLPLSCAKFKKVIGMASFNLQDFILQLYLLEKNLDNPSSCAKKLTSLLSSVKDMHLAKLKCLYEALVKIIPFDRDAAKTYAIKFWNTSIFTHLFSQLPYGPTTLWRGITIDSTQCTPPLIIANQINEFLQVKALEFSEDKVKTEIENFLRNAAARTRALYCFIRPSEAQQIFDISKCPHQNFMQVLPLLIYELSVDELEKLLKDRQEIWSELPFLIPFCNPSQKLWLKEKILKIGKNEHNSHEFVLPIHVLFRLKRALNMPINPVVQTNRKRKRQEEVESVFKSAIPKYLRGSIVEKFPLKGSQLTTHLKAIKAICNKFGVKEDDLDNNGLEFLTIHAILMHFAEDQFTTYSEERQSEYLNLLVETVIKALGEKEIICKEDFLKYLGENS